MISDVAILVPLGGFVLGLVVGMAARWVAFCTLGAIADAMIVGDQRRLRGWGLAVAVALGGSQMLHMAGLVDLGQSIYLAGGFGWLGALLGGALFGFGMALIGTCGFGMLIRLGGGDQRALIDTAVLGVFAYITLSGPLAYVRELGIVDLAAALIGQSVEGVRPIIVGVVIASLLLYSLTDPSFRKTHREIVAAVVIGLAIVAGWLITGLWGQDPFYPTPPASLTFVRPLGDSLLYLMLMSGLSVSFGVASVFGAVTGAFLVVRLKKEWRLEGFDSAREMRRHIIGAALMGVGGVMALGCTIGQGMTGLSTLALSAPLTCLAIFAGAALGLRYLEERSLARAFGLLIGRKLS